MFFFFIRDLVKIELLNIVTQIFDLNYIISSRIACSIKKKKKYEKKPFNCVLTIVIL